MDPRAHPGPGGGDHRGRYDVVVVAPTVAATELLEAGADLAADGAVLLVYGGTRKGDTFPLEKLTSWRIGLDDFPRQVMDLAAELVDFPGKVVIDLAPAAPRRP